MTIITKNKVAIFLALVLIMGAAVIIYQEQPVRELMKEYALESGDESLDFALESESSQSLMINGSLFFSLAEVAANNSPEKCWAAVNGEVYDLSSWISRHPGGSSAIINMCGKDASEDFNRQHGRSTAAQAALILFKIGSLQ